MPRLCSLALALLLFTAEAVVAVQAVFLPHVSRFYTQFYIQNIRTCWLPEADVAGVADGLRGRFDIAGLTAPQHCYVLMAGWTHTEPWGVWSSKRVARLDVPVAPGAKVLVLRLVAVGPAQVVDVLVADRLVTRVALGAGERDVAVPVTAPGDVVVTLRPAGFFSRHGIGLLGVLWQ